MSTSKLIPETASSRDESNAFFDAIGSRSAIVLQILKGFASLKLTVVLFALSIFLILIGTLAQIDMGIWEVMADYFTSWVAIVPFQVFLPRSWFPNWQNIPGWLPFPGGASIGTMTVINLIAAHLVRFKIQARGFRLAVGLTTIVLGIFVTALVVTSGHNANGTQGDPPIDYKTLWLCFKSFLLASGLFVGGYAGSLFTRQKRGIFAATTIASLLLLTTTIWLFVQGDRVYLGDAGMRILWQLQQAGFGSLILLGGCWMVFKKRAGIVLLHSGVGLLMFGQFFVTQYDVEEQMTIPEGNTIDYGQDIRAVELAIVREDSQENLVTAIPLIRNGKSSGFLDQQSIRPDALPFDIEVIDFFRNSTFRELEPDQENIATHGVGLRYVAERLRPGSGTGDSKVNLASAYVRLTQRNGFKVLGTYLLSQPLGNQERIEVDGKDFELSVRFERHYKPYSVQLIDVRADHYLGTTTPKNYSSDVRLIHQGLNVDREDHIWMNNPLRFAGETFYQSGYQNLQGREYTTFQVVKNAGWMIPYVSCMLVLFGMTFHFLTKLIGFLLRHERSTEEQSAGRGAVWVPLTVTALVVLGLGYFTFKDPQNSTEMNIHEFGKLPLVNEGRVKPYDTLARNSLRFISDQATYKDTEGKRQPAIRWLLDVLSHSDDAERHRVFRIQNLNVLNTLGLPRRQRFRYALEEFKPRMDEFRKQVELARSSDIEQLSVYQKKILELEERLQLYFKLRESYRVPDLSMTGPDQQLYLLLAMARADRELAEAPVPRAIPADSDSSDETWLPLASALNTLSLKNMAKNLEAADPEELSQRLVDRLLSEEGLAKLIPLRVTNMIEDILRNNDTSSSDSELKVKARQMYGQMDEAMRKSTHEAARQALRREVGPLKLQLQTAIQQSLKGETLQSPTNLFSQAMETMMSSYREDNSEPFNVAIQEFQNALTSVRRQQYQTESTEFESFFNHASLFTQSQILYLLVFFLSLVSWIGWRQPLNRTAFCLIVLALLIHSFALLARIYLSGRPPVTNLYSSAVFIGWGCVILGIALELLFGLGIGNVLGAATGFSTLIIAHSLSGNGDTIGVLQAVLDTQFWLATHVVCVTCGYAATLFAGAAGIFYILFGILTPAGSPAVRKSTARIIYGVICFAILFSFVGTVLGGLWADDSWGRFWGWDPKENGALIIVIWNALVLHARWGGMVRERGLAVLATAGNIAVIWSWFGVNELGVGLHSYGFTEGVLFKLACWVLFHLGIIGMGLVPTDKWWSYRRCAETSTLSS
jgi:ABC-type transport system involved in cytochrome c biogenesis permease subunit